MNACMTCANAQRMANQVNTATSGTGVVQQATHKDDLISTVIGGNTATGGVDASFVDAHTTYGPNVLKESAQKVWGDINGSSPVIIKPNNK